LGPGSAGLRIARSARVDEAYTDRGCASPYAQGTLYTLYIVFPLVNLPVINIIAFLS